VISYWTLFHSPSLYASSDDSLNGVWQPEGYGFFFVINAPDVMIYEASKVSCYPSILQANKLSEASVIDETGTFPVSVPGFIDALIKIQSTSDADIKYFHRTDTASPMKMRRVDTLPKQCFVEEEGIHHTVNVFLTYFEEHYPFFSERKVNWNRDDILSKATSIDGDEALFDFLVGLVSPLFDPHIVIAAPSLDRYYFGNEHSQGPIGYEGVEQLLLNIERQYSISKLAYYCDGSIAFSTLKSGDKYLKINDFSDCNDEIDQIQTMIIKAAANHDLIIDLRSNIGGSDAVALKWLSRLTQDDYTAYFKQAAIDYNRTKAWSEPWAVKVISDEGVIFDGDIILITDAATVSAAETFTMGIKNRKPTVTHVGMATAGGFSDILPRILPNGFLLGLPNERFLDKNGQSYDITGIKPDIEVMLDPDLFLGAKDTQLEAAIGILAKRKER
jgi:hypothetical protein